MPEKTTMRDVARAAAVSITTVSRVINGDPYVAEETSQRVRDAIARLDYRINPMARSLRTGSDEAVGLVVESIGDPFFAAVIDAVEQAARAAGLFLLIASAGETAGQERAVVAGLLNRSVQGMLIVPCHLDYASERLPIGAGHADGVPVVFIDRPTPGLDADTVMIDNAANARMATEHLIAHGHRRIAFAGVEVARYTVGERLAGFRAALADHGLTFDPAEVVDLHHRYPDAGTQLLDRALSSEDPVTAVVTANATASLAVVRELHRIGRADVAVVSFDDFPMADALDPPITVALQDPVEMGRRAFELLLGRIRGDHGPPSRLVLPTTFIERGSGELSPSDQPEPTTTGA
jgi:LacI family transcriptional regulator